MIELIIPGIPVPWRAPQVTRNGAFSLQTQMKNHIRREVAEQYKGPPLTGPLWVQFIFHMPIPTTLRTPERKLLAEGKYWPARRPDRTNMLKLYEDCLNGIVYVDDNQVVDGPVTKLYDKNPKVLITIKKLPL